MNVRCVACEYGEDSAIGNRCPFCEQRMELGDVLALKDMQADRGTRAALIAAGYRVGTY